MAEDAAVFLTGATGFVGGHVLRALLDAGYVSSQKAGATGAVCQDAPSMRIAARGAMRLARLGNWHAPETRS